MRETAANARVCQGEGASAAKPAPEPQVSGGPLISLSHGNAISSTSRYKNNSALKAWLFVELGILRSVASTVRKASTCGAPMSRGCFHRAVAAMPAHEKPNPIQVNLLSTEATVHISNLLPNLVKQPDGLQRRGSGFHGHFYNCIKKSVVPVNPIHKSLAGDFSAKIKPQSPRYTAGFAAYITLKLK